VPETRRQFTAEFWKGAVRIARETGRPIAQIARALGINAGTRGTGSPGITPAAVTYCSRRGVPHLTAAPGRAPAALVPSGVDRLEGEVGEPLRLREDGPVQLRHAGGGAVKEPGLPAGGEGVEVVEVDDAEAGQRLRRSVDVVATGDPALIRWAGGKPVGTEKFVA
jgi:hypothetical protein